MTQERVFVVRALNNTGKYFKDVGNFKPLSKEEETRLILLSQQGDSKSTELLVKSNLKFVARVAYNYVNPKVEYIDLIGEGNLGLLDAIKRFDVNKKFKLNTYAVWWIKKRILEYIYKQNNLFSCSSLLSLKSFGVFKKNKNIPFRQKIGGCMMIDVSDKDYMSMVPVLISTSKSYDTSANPYDFYDYTNYYHTQSEITSFEQSDSEKTAVKFIKTKLNEEDNKIIDMRFGLTNGTPMNFFEMADEMGCSHQNIRRKYYSVIEKIKAKKEIQDKFSEVVV